MKIIGGIQKIILGYPVGEPIFSKDIVKVIPELILKHINTNEDYFIKSFFKR